MRKLVAEDSDGSAEAPRDAADECSTYRQTVAEVMDAVSKDYHPRNGRHGARHLVAVVMRVTMVTVIVLAFRFFIIVVMLTSSA